MEDLQKSSSGSIPPPRNGRFFKEFGAGVCLFGRVDRGSRIRVSNYKAAVYDYPKLLSVLRTPLASNWTFDHWKRLATFLNLRASSLPAAIDGNAAASESITDAFLSRLTSVTAAATGPLLSADSGEMCGRAVVERLLEDGNFLLLGSSGLGKSFHLNHLIMRAIHEQMVPI